MSYKTTILNNYFEDLLARIAFYATIGEKQRILEAVKIFNDKLKECDNITLKSE